MTALRVLVADDNADVRRIVIELLSSDFQVIGEAADGQDLIQCAVSLQPDIVVSDIVMPLMDGLSAKEHLRSMSLRPPFAESSPAPQCLEQCHARTRRPLSIADRERHARQLRCE